MRQKSNKTEWKWYYVMKFDRLLCFTWFSYCQTGEMHNSRTQAYELKQLSYWKHGLHLFSVITLHCLGRVDKHFIKCRVWNHLCDWLDVEWEIGSRLPLLECWWRQLLVSQEVMNQLLSLPRSKCWNLVSGTTNCNKCQSFKDNCPSTHLRS